MKRARDERHGLLLNYSNNIVDTVTNNVDSIHVNGPWSITFEWEKGDAFRVDLEQYHLGKLWENILLSAL